MLKIKNDMRMNNDQSSQVLNDVVRKVNQLEMSLAKEEQTRIELQSKLLRSEEQNLELSNFIKSLQSQSEQELAQMRNILQSKLSEDHMDKVKSNEKNSILFQELVRIGQQSEK